MPPPSSAGPLSPLLALLTPDEARDFLPEAAITPAVYHQST